MAKPPSSRPQHRPACSRKTGSQLYIGLVPVHSCQVQRRHANRIPFLCENPTTMLNAKLLRKPAPNPFNLKKLVNLQPFRNLSSHVHQQPLPNITNTCKALFLLCFTSFADLKNHLTAFSY